METVKRAVSLLLCLVMVVGLLPLSAFAATGDDALTTALTEATAYIDALTVNNSANDPSEVVAKHGTHFTWDNEKREKSQLYLYDWSYYNGVVFEGLQYLYEVTGEEAYKNYVIEYLSTMIDANGDWAVCANNSEMTAAGYVDHHGADCYKTASMLLDAYELTGDDRYLTMAKELYLDLNAGDNSNVVLLDEAGYNYRHTWTTDPAQDLWLDGLYMILPFRAEYAAYIEDDAELDLIVDRLTWVSENMYNGDGLFYHAANNASDNSGTYWLRSIGWYAAAIADVMDSVSEADRAVLAKQLVKLAEGLLKRQGDNGMWQNDLAAAVSENNPYETSGTALVCYAVLKAVNNGWIEEAYADMAIKGFVGICENKLENNNLTDICFKGVPGGSNSTYYDNEGKGVGPFIMLTAEVKEYVNENPTVTESYKAVLEDIRVAYTRETLLGDELDLTVYAVYSDGSEVLLTDDQYTVFGYDPNKTGSQGIIVTYGDFSYGFNVVTLDSGVTVVGKGVSGLTAADVTEDETVAAAMAAVETNGFVAYDFTANTNAAVVSIPVPADWAEGKLVAYYIDETGKIAETIPAEYANGKAVFEVEHFSTYAVSNEPMATAETGWVAYEGESYYTMDTSMETGVAYVIARDGYEYVLTRSGASITDTQVSITENDDNYSIATVADSMKWYIDSSNHIYCIVDGTPYYLNVSNSALQVSATASSTWTITSISDTTAQISTRSGNYTYYLRYTSNEFSITNSNSNQTRRYMNLYRETTQAGGQARLTGTLDQSVKLSDGTTQDTILSKVTVEWDSNSDGIADSTIPISDCDVTGSYNNAATGDYTLTIAYNGKTLGNVTVHVVDKEVKTATLSGNTPVTTKLGVEPDFSNIKLTVTYDDGTNEIITTANGLVITDYDITNTGVNVAKISYAGVQYGTVRVTVEGNPYAGKDPATKYPEYPADGAVRINKHATELDFATTGLVNVELDVAGVSVKTGVDVVLVVDVSNSMGWSLENSAMNYSNDYQKRAYGDQLTKLEIAMQSASNFADIVLQDNTGSTADNTLSFVTFAGYDTTFGKDSRDDGLADSLMEVFQREDSATDAKTSFAGTYFDKRTSASDTTATYKLTITDNTGKKVVDAVANRGDTNYDYAFWQALKTVNSIKAYNEANGQGGREVFIVFMTDGAPSHYNTVTRNSTSGRSDLVPDSNLYYNRTGTTNHTQDSWYTFFSTNPNDYGVDLYSAVDGNFVSIGFDLEHGGFSGWQWSEDELVAALEQVAHETEKIDVHATAGKDELGQIFKDVATKIKYAGTSAQTTDIIDPDFTLQMGNTTGTAGEGIGVVNIADKGYTPTITIKTYDLVTKADLGKEVVVDGLATVVTEDMVGKTYTVDGKELEIKETHVGTTILLDNQTVTVTETHLGMRKNTAPTAIETVTFNDDGTEAYIRTGTGTTDDPYGYSDNIMDIADDGTVTITATYFTYTNVEGVETFKWNIGNITDKEIALSYYAYLKGSLEGEEADGLKYTNEEAILEYIDINGDYATQTFPVPAVAWGGASTAYEFYLVNEAGQPCNRQGDVVPFANRVIITGPFYQDLYLNQSDEEIAQEIIAVKVLPAGYTLYDNTAKYEVQTASGNNQGSLVISDPAAGKTQTTILVSAVTPSYIQSRVAFGVMYNMIPEDADFIMAPDKVVIDYGKSIEINVNANNDNIPDTVNVNLIGFSMFYDNVDVTQKFEDTPYSTPFEGTYGTFSIAENGNVLYTPHRMLNAPGKIFCVYKITAKTNAEDFYYMVTELDVIPATIMYYETNFADGVFTEKGEWTTKTEGAAADGPQNDGTIGQNTYGFDTTYDNDAYLSNGSSKFVLGAIDDNGKYLTTTSFSFTGTGFDLISRTGENQGLIKVQVATDSAMTNIVKTISVLNKSESNLELYQIPVVSINGLDHSTYYVKISVDTSFVNDTGIPALDALARGNEFYFDAIRIYDPAEGNSIAEAAYNADGEANNSLDEVRALLLNAETYATISGSTTGMVFVDNVNSGTNTPGASGDVQVATYKTIGPNNEVYLSKDQAVAFKVKADSIPASFDIGAKSIEGNIAGLEVTICNADGSEYWSVAQEIKSSTVQYIDLLDAAGADPSVLYQGAYVVITNTADGVLSITDLKTAFSVAAAAQTEQLHSDLTRLSGVSLMSEAAEIEAYDPFAVSYTVDAATFDVARAVLTAPAEPEVPETPDEPEIPDEPVVDTSMYNILSASVKANGSFKSRKYTITVVTSQMVEDILVMHEGSELAVSKITSKDKKKTDTREWTIVLTAKGLEQYNSFTLTGVGSDGLMGEAFEVSTSSNHGRNDK